MSNDFNTDVIVVGAGPAGISAAIEIAKNGRKVVLLERAQYPGSKNVYGGAVYHKALEFVFKDQVQELPYERIINEHTYSFLNEDSSFEMTYKNANSKNAYAIKRFNLEHWMIEQAKKQGVYYSPNTLVKKLIENNGSVIGVETEFEQYFAPVVILADGVNSLLAKKLGLRENFKSKNFILSAKEVIKLNKKIIEQRFNLKEDLTNGVNKQYFGSDFGKLKGIKNLFMMSYLYTFKDTISIGVGVNLEDLAKTKLNINEVLDAVKQHPDIAPLIEDGQLIEYSAHLIPEGGFNNLPKLYANGVMLVGDAAGFVNSVHFEGTNFALVSGKLAGETALIALDDNDFRESKLSVYKEKLEESFILKDLYAYRNVIELLHSRANSLSVYYPNKIKEFFEIVTGVSCTPKAKEFRGFLIQFIKDRKISELFKDIYAFSKCALDVLLGK